MVPSLTESQFNIAIGNLFQAMLPQLALGQIIIGQTNRVASPQGDYVVYWPLRRDRLGTDVEIPVDAVFTGSIAPIDANTATMTITAKDPNFKGTIAIGGTIFGANVAANTIVQSQILGQQGGVGTYVVSPSQTVSSETLAAGVINIDQSTEVVIQIDVHGPNSGDNAQVISTLLRNQFAVDQLQGTGVSPLHADHPRQVPFHTAAVQYEERWIIEAHFQIIPVISIPQEFAAAAKVNPVSVTVAYPPT